MVETTLPSDLEKLAGLDPTVIHGDLHPENVLVEGASISIIGWQTCSFGSVLHDVVRLAGESLRGDHDGQRMRQVVDDHLDRLEAMGVPSAGIASTRGALDSSLRVLFAGVTTGYGTPDELTGHDASVAATLASEDGLAGLMAAHFNLDITLPPAPAARKNDDHEHHDRPVRNNHHH